jgi:hypothetical protein
MVAKGRSAGAPRTLGMKTTLTWRMHAAFSRNGGRTWFWVTWTTGEPNKHAAIIDKARELGVNAWDFGNADKTETLTCGYCGTELADLGAHGIGCPACAEAEDVANFGPSEIVSR